MPKITYPYLEVETKTPHQTDIETLFDKVKNLNLAYKAKSILYPLRTDFKNIFIGGGANHIWFHHNEEGEMSEKRVAIIHFNPYYGIEKVVE